MRAIVLLVAALFVLAAPSLASSDAAERERLVAERRHLNELSAAQEQACRERFLVNDCVAKVRARRREELRPLRERELQLDDADRRQRALDREASREGRRFRPVPVPRAASGSDLAERATRPARGAASAAPPAEISRRGDDPQARAAEAAARVRASELRAQEARATQANVSRRVAERNASGKKTTPLPTPSASEATR
jgi:hypothetical protein